MWGLVGMYLAAIVAANLSVAAFGPAVSIVNAFVFIALDLTARDRLHEAWQVRGLAWKMGLLIATGSALSYGLARLLPSTMPPDLVARIALASLIAFGVSAALDALCYHLLRERAYLVKVNGSNVVSAAADSLIFPTLAFGALLPWIVLGQFIAKVAGGAV
jgi:queuosine precursor transporter